MRTMPTVFLDGHGCSLFSSWLHSVHLMMAICAGFGKITQVPRSKKKKKGFFFFASLQTTKKQAISSMGWYHQCVGAEMCPPLVSILLGHHFFSWWKLSSGLQITNLREPFRETALPLGATELLYCIYCYPPIRLGCWRIWYFMAA